MTAQQLYDMEPEAVTRELRALCGPRFNHVPEAADTALSWYYRESDRIEIRTVCYAELDHVRAWHLASVWFRTWHLATVWFDGIPVMVIQTAGVEGRSHCERFITNPQAFESLVYHLKILAAEDNDPPASVSADEDIPALTEFFGTDLRKLRAQ